MARSEPGEQKGTEPLRALVADDEAAMRLLFRANLEAAGLQVVAAADGLEAVRAATELRPDVAVLDIWMPGLDGFQVAQKLRELHDGLFGLVFISAGIQRDLDERAASYDGRFVAKPFDPIEVTTSVRKLAEAARSRSARLVDDAKALQAQAKHQAQRAEENLSDGLP